MPSNPKKGKTLKCTENLKEFYENEDEFKFPEGGLLKQEYVHLIIITDRQCLCNHILQPSFFL